MHTSTKIIHMRISAVASLSRTGADKILDPQGHGISSRAVAIYAREGNLSDLYFIFIGYLRIAPCVKDEDQKQQRADGKHLRHPHRIRGKLRERQPEDRHPG